MQYVIIVCLVWTGAAVILNFRNSPDIIFCSLALAFVCKVDDIFYEFFDAAFDLDVEFQVKLCFVDEGKGLDVPRKHIPFWIIVLKRFASIFPLLLGYYTFAHAWYTHATPLRTVGWNRFENMVKDIVR